MLKVDGATICIPPSSKAAAESALVAAKQMAKNNFGLDLRIGMIAMSDIEEAATEAFSEHITSCTVIVTSDDSRFDHGTGVAVKYRDKYFVLTAAHPLIPLGLQLVSSKV